jgi:hypothetical protein
MTPEEKMPTIRQDVFEISRRVDRARGMARTSKQTEIWNELDLAIARLQGLSMFIRSPDSEPTSKVAP